MCFLKKTNDYLVAYFTVDSMDAHMHPAVMRQLEIDFGLSPKSLGLLSLIQVNNCGERSLKLAGKISIAKTNQVVFLCLAQGLSAALFGPIWGLVSDAYNRKVCANTGHSRPCPPLVCMHKL